MFLNLSFWDRQVLDKLHLALEAEAKVKRDLPGLVVLMNKPRTEDKGLHALGDLSSTYRDSFSDNSPLEFVGHRPDFTFTRSEDEVGAGLNNAAKVLCVGTTKGTHHIPGFRGHIPANMRNPVKFEHGMGKVAHPVYNNLVLSQRGMGCVLGYSGEHKIYFLFSSSNIVTFFAPNFNRPRSSRNQRWSISRKKDIMRPKDFEWSCLLGI